MRKQVYRDLHGATREYRGRFPHQWLTHRRKARPSFVGDGEVEPGTLALGGEFDRVTREVVDTDAHRNRFEQHQRVAVRFELDGELSATAQRSGQHDAQHGNN